MTVFEEIKVESRDWTGYNSDLVDKIIERGTELEEDNSRLIRQAKRDFWENLGSIFGGVFAISIIIFSFTFGAIVLSNSNKRGQIYYYGYQQGQIDVLSKRAINFELVTNDSNENIWTLVEHPDVTSWGNVGGSYAKRTWKLINSYEFTRD